MLPKSAGLSNWSGRRDLNPRPLDPQNAGLGVLPLGGIRAARHDVLPHAGWLAARMACGPQVAPGIGERRAMLAVVVSAQGAVLSGARAAPSLGAAQTMLKDAILDRQATGGDSDHGQSGRCGRAAGSRPRVDRRAGTA